jgi:hypothetical protein
MPLSPRAIRLRTECQKTQRAQKALYESTRTQAHMATAIPAPVAGGAKLKEKLCAQQ